MLTFLQISDTHISADPNYHPPWVPDAIRHPNRGVEALLNAVGQLPFEVDFILHTGDVCADPEVDNYHCARELLSQFKQAVYLLPGNHDSAEMMKDILHDGKQLHVLRDDLVTVKGWNLLTLDSNSASDAHAPLMQEQQIESLATNLADLQGKPIIVALHHPLIKTGVDWLDDAMRVQNGERIHKILSRHADHIAGVFHGHIHQQTSMVSGGLLYTCCPSTWSNLSAYPGMRKNEADLHTKGGFNLVMNRQSGTFIRRYSLPAGA